MHLYQCQNTNSSTKLTNLNQRFTDSVEKRLTTAQSNGVRARRSSSKYTPVTRPVLALLTPRPPLLVIRFGPEFTCLGVPKEHRRSSSSPSNGVVGGGRGGGRRRSPQPVTVRCHGGVMMQR